MTNTKMLQVIAKERAREHFDALRGDDLADALLELGGTVDELGMLARIVEPLRKGDMTTIAMELTIYFDQMRDAYTESWWERFVPTRDEA